MGKISQFVAKIVTFFKRLRYRFPSDLPKGATEFDKFVASITSAYGLPNHPSYVHTIATMIMQLKSTQDRAPKLYFAQSVRKAMANQVAYDRITKLREERAEAQKLDTQTGASNEQPVQG